jgi:lambda repressor-like predicted transcriptional regulator
MPSHRRHWLPTPVRTYLAHTEAGTSIRALARKAGVHPSTVLRQVRRTEMLRDDPLADAALNRLGRYLAHPTPGRDIVQQPGSAAHDCPEG